ncbi:hypothetical protein HDV05_006109 [Chytridiales sp. JEL 0842]|nr:hypothetical protein HDV05_006109 [Chytridiales sp. JEL 0842]
MKLAESPLRQKLPTELVDHIFSFADPLTLYLNNRLSSSNETVNTSVWKIAFETSWEGDLNLLPSTGFPNADQGLCTVHSRELYSRLCIFRPEYTENVPTRFISPETGLPYIKQPFLRADNKWNAIHPPKKTTATGGSARTALLGATKVPGVQDYQTFFAKEFEYRLLQIPMRNGWWDLFPGLTWVKEHVQVLGRIAVRFGHWKLLKYLAAELAIFNPFETEPFHGSVLTTLAAANGHLEILKTLSLELNCPLTADTLDLACANGHWDVVQYLHFQTQTPCTTQAMNEASAMGHLGIVKFLHENRVEGCTKDAMNRASKNGHLNVIQFLHEHRSEGCTNAAIDSAASSGHLQIIKYLHTHRSEGCTYLALDNAAAGGHLHVLRYLREAYPNLEPSQGALNDASSNGYLQTLQWLLSEFPKVDTSMCMYSAADQGQIHVLKWLDEQGSFKWRRKYDFERVPEHLAADGHLEVLKYVYKRAFEPFVGVCMNAAAKTGELEVVKWLHEGRLVGCTTKAMDAAASNGFLDVVKFLHAERKEGCTAAAMDAAASNGFLDVVDFLHAERKGCTTDAVDGAAENGHLEVVMYLLENRGEGCSADAMLKAAENGHVEVA